MPRYVVYPLLPLTFGLLLFYIAWRDSPWAINRDQAPVILDLTVDTDDPDLQELRSEPAAQSTELPSDTATTPIAVDLGRRLGRGLSGEAFDAFVVPAGVSPDTIIESAADTLTAGNSSTQPQAMRDRMALIDFLGVMARTNSTARQRLFDFALSPPDSSRPTAWLHMDVTDRLEAFVYVAALAPDVAVAHIRTLPGSQFKSRYIVQFVAGLEYGGETHDEAVSEAFETFYGDSDLAFATTNHQEGQP